MSSSNLRPKKGKHRVAANSSSVASGSKTKAGQESPNLRRKLDFPGTSSKARKADETDRPLKGKVFHLNVKRPQFAKRLKEDLEYLGGTVDPFLNGDVWYLITDNIEAKAASGKGSAKGTNQAGPASPAVSTPSPFHHTRGSIENADSRSVSTNQETGPVTRGQALVQKAVKSKGGSSNVLATAKNLRIHIYHVDGIRKYLEKSKEKLQQKLESQKSKGHDSTPKDSSKPSTSREKRLTRPYLKYEDASRHYRPVTKEFSSVPRVMVDTTRGSCPFDLHPQRKENKEQRAERNCDEGAGEMLPPNSVKKPSGAQKTPSNKTGQSSRKKGETTGVKEKRRGYCECCAVKYDDLEKHLKSQQHIEFVAKQNNYVNLDKMIAEGPNIDRFLDDVMKYHETDIIKGQAIQHELDEVLLVSSPVVKQPDSSKDDNQSTRKPPPVFAVPMSPPKSPTKRFKILTKAAPPSPVKSPRTTKLSLRQRSSPRLLDGEPKSPEPPPSTPRGTEISSVSTFEKLPGKESRIVPKRPPSSQASSSVWAGKGSKPSRPQSPRAAKGRSGKEGSDTAKEKALEAKRKLADTNTDGADTGGKVEEDMEVDEGKEEKQSASGRKTRRSLEPSETKPKETKNDERGNDQERTCQKNAQDLPNDGKESSGSKSERKKRKLSQVPPDVIEDDVFEPDTRRFRTPGRKPGNFTQTGDSKKSRTQRPDANEHETEARELSSPHGMSLRSCGPDDGNPSDTKELPPKPNRKRKPEDVSESETKRQRTGNDEEDKKAQRNLRTRTNVHEGKVGSPGRSPKSSDDFREEQQVRRSGRGNAKPNYAKQLLKTKKEREIGKLKKTEQQKAILSRMNRVHKQGDANETSSDQNLKWSNRNETLSRKDIDKVIREKMENKTTSVSSNKNSTWSSTGVQPPSSTGLKPLPATEPLTVVQEEEPRTEPRTEPNLPSMFRSDSSVDSNFWGFGNGEINETGDKLRNLSATKDVGYEQKLEQSGLNVCCLPSSEMELVEKRSESSGSSVDLADVSKVLQSLENFGSEGSEWEAPINRYFDKFDEVVEDLKRRTSELQALTPKSHLRQSDGLEEDDSLKENVQQDDTGNQQNLLLSSEGNIADGIADIPSTAAMDDTLTRRRSARIQDKGSVCSETSTVDVLPTTQAVPYVKSSGKTFATQNDSGIFKAPFPSPKKKHGHQFATSTPNRPGTSTQQDSPVIAIPKGVDKDLLLDNYVHDETEAEISFPNLSSPNKPGLLLSPVKYVMLNNGEIGSPQVRRRKSNLSMSKDGFAYNVSPGNKPEARKSLFKLKRSISLSIPKISSPDSHQLPSPTPPSEFDNISNMNRSLSTPLSASSFSKSPSFTYLSNGQNRKRTGSLSINNKRPNFSSSILKPAKKGLNAKRLSQKQPPSKEAAGKKRVKTKGAKRHILLSDTDTDKDVYEFVDEGLVQSQSSSQAESPPGIKGKNMVSVSIQTNEEDLESDGTMRVRVPPSPVKQHLSPVKNRLPRQAETVLLGSFNPVVNLEKSVLPIEFWMH